VGNIPRSTRSVQQHLSPAAQFFTEEELSAQAERVAYLPTGPEPEVVSEAEWARSDALLVAMESERALADRVPGRCHRCTMHCADLIGFQGEGLCGECALYLVEVA
jgi:hypothetical protein